VCVSDHGHVNYNSAVSDKWVSSRDVYSCQQFTVGTDCWPAAVIKSVIYTTSCGLFEFS